MGRATAWLVLRKSIPVTTHRVSGSKILQDADLYTDWRRDAGKGGRSDCGSLAWMRSLRVHAAIFDCTVGMSGL